MQAVSTAGATTAFLVVSSGLLAAQDVRASVVLGEGTGTDAIATDGDQSLALWIDGVFEDKLWASTSDGRGLEWSPQFVLSEDYGFADNVRVEIVDGRTYAIWSEGESSPSPGILLASRSFDGGQTWDLPTQIPAAPAWDGFVDRVRGLEVVPVGAVDHVHLLLATAEGELSLVSSYDSGVSFQAPVVLTTNYVDGTSLSSLAVGDGILHVAWLEQTSPSTTAHVYRRSVGGGVTFTPALTFESIGPGAWNSVRMGVQGQTVVLASWEAPQTIRTQTSFDGGATFQPPVELSHGLVQGSVVLVDLAASLHVSGSDVWVTWASADLTLPGSRRSTEVAYSPDAGQTWGAPQTLLPSAESFTPPQVLTVGEQRLLLIGDTDPQGAFWNVATESFDPLFDITGLEGTGISGFELLATVNDQYSNLITLFEVFAGGTNLIRAGGLRPQTLISKGFLGGLTSVNFEFERFDSQSTAGWVLLSLNQGDWFLPDGRNLGIVPDGFAVGSIDLALQGLGSGLLDPFGNGASPVLNIGLPPGLTLEAVGIGVDLVTFEIGVITDVVTLSS